MNIPDEMRCAWMQGGSMGMRCMCPATLSMSKFCVFHRHPDEVDVAGIVAWSQHAAPEEYQARIKAFMYPGDSQAVRRLKVQIEAHRSGEAVGIVSSRLFPKREPGDDEELAA
jgi:hypothetical protein